MTLEHREIERLLIDASVGDSSKYAGVNNLTALNTFTFGVLDKTFKGEGEYFVHVIDKRKGTEEDVPIRSAIIDEFGGTNGRLEYVRAITEANDLAPLQKETLPTAPIPERQGPGLGNRIWNSKPVRNLRRATALYGTIGLFTGTTLFGGIKGCEVVAQSSLDKYRETYTELVEEIKKNPVAGSKGNPVSNFHGRLEDIESAQMELVDGSISIDELDFWNGKLGHFRKSSVAGISINDNYPDQLEVLLDRAYEQIQTRDQITKDARKFTKSLEELSQASISPENKTKLEQMSREARDYAERSSSIPLDSALGRAISSTLIGYEIFLKDLQENGTYDTWLAEESKGRIKDNWFEREIGAPIIGGLVGLGAGELIFGLGILGHHLCTRKKKEEEQNNSVEKEEEDTPALSLV